MIKAAPTTTRRKIPAAATIHKVFFCSMINSSFQKAKSKCFLPIRSISENQKKCLENCELLFFMNYFWNGLFLQHSIIFYRRILIQNKPSCFGFAHAHCRAKNVFLFSCVFRVLPKKIAKSKILKKNGGNFRPAHLA